MPVPPNRVFELRTYTAHDGKLEALLARFRDHTLALFARHNIASLAYFTPRDGPLAGRTLIYLLAHLSREAAEQNWNAFRADPDWLEARAASESDGPIVARLESVFLDPADFSPLK